MKKIVLFLCLVALAVSLCSCKEKTEVITAYLEDGLTAEEISAVEDSVLAIDEVQTAAYVSGDEALKNFVAQHQDDQAFSNIDTSYIRGRFTVTVAAKDAQAVAGKLEKIPGVDHVTTAADPGLVVRFGIWLQEMLAK